MSFNWREYISFAQELSSRTDEAALRSSVSRAYYGAFSICRIHFGLTRIKTGEVHKLVSEKLNDSDDQQVLIAGQYIDDLWKERKNCDYEGFYNITQSNADKLVKKAVKVIEIMNDI